MPLDAFYLLVEGAHRAEGRTRAGTVQDTIAAIGGAFSKKKDTIKDYIKALLDTP
jgi:hypothetical protein